jgi:hypothetical protein
MKSLIIASFVFAVVGTSVELSWVPALSEPARLAIWGTALLTFSGVVRRWLGTRRADLT